jgi:signal peptidase II
MGKSTWGKAAALASFVLVLDLGTKALASVALDLNESRELLPFLTAVLAHNPGVNFLTGQYIPIYVVAVMGLVVAIHLFRNPPTRLPWVPIGLFVGGGLGNLVERAHHGYATDFLQIQGTTAVFNLADVAIFAAFFFLLDDEEDEKDEGPEKAQASSAELSNRGSALFGGLD